MRHVAHENATLTRHYLLSERSPLDSLLLAAAAISLATGCAVAATDGEPIDKREEAQQKPPGPPPPPDVLLRISAGHDHTCVQRRSGKVYCWGIDDYGQAGPGSVACANGVQCVKKPTLITTAARLSVGYSHTCVLDLSGRVFCWGANDLGQLGIGTTVFTPTLPAAAVPVSLNGTPMTFSQISAGDHTTCGVTLGSGNVYCWGASVQPGNGYSGTPLPLTNDSGNIVLDRISTVATGGRYTCVEWQFTNGAGIDTECWERATWALAPQLTFPFGLPSGVVSLASGVSATCADTTNGMVRCFGDNSVGQLGNGTVGGISSTPVTVGGGMALHGVTTGTYHACALDPNGYAYCWGSGSRNQLGQMTATVPAASSTNPVAVAAFDQTGAGVRFSALGAGDMHTCGISTDDHVYCWGDNGYGQLGTGTWQNAAKIATQALDPL